MTLKPGEWIKDIRDNTLIGVVSIVRPNGAVEIWTGGEPMLYERSPLLEIAVVPTFQVCSDCLGGFYHITQFLDEGGKLVNYCISCRAATDRTDHIAKEER